MIVGKGNVLANRKNIINAEKMLLLPLFIYNPIKLVSSRHLRIVEPACRA